MRERAFSSQKLYSCTALFRFQDVIFTWPYFIYINTNSDRRMNFYLSLDLDLDPDIKSIYPSAEIGY